MSVLANSRHERFVQFLMQGETAVDAHQHAGYRRNDGNASTLLNDPRIQARLKELKGKSAVAVVVNAETLIAEAEQVRAQAVENRQFSAAVGAIREKGVLSGHRIERREVGGPGEFDHMTDDELRRALVERIKALGLAGRDTRH